ncbi:MAG: coproporphyrinogen III oxidase [Dactylosporangium sp.]|nr:radical SAM family heme chaperone HemW [Dactylosporangium sp.]NNJ63567.1 coproporphyrinogen III oxidase [Dactylosporangium sp.]
MHMVLPDVALAAVGARGFGVYVHVPFCARRCGYCDFNTYTPAESGLRGGYIDALLGEAQRAALVLGGAGPPLVETVFFGGGTPTLLPAADLGRVLERLDRLWGLASDAEVTTEANPESVSPATLRALRAAGFTRLSVGMQSVAPHVLALLDRRHEPGQALAAVEAARAAGFDHVNLDLIYGTPGETPEDFAGSLAAAVNAGVDHVSAYALIIEEGTPLAARMARGEVPYPDDDVAADRYLAAEEALSAAGFSWYEVSNWARGVSGRCRHNLGYWRGADWWGFGAGAHSHLGGVRWWNVARPGDYRDRLARGLPVVAGSETLTEADRQVETVLLGVRLAEGLPAGALRGPAAAEAEAAVAEGLLDAGAWRVGRAVLTVRGRLLADAVVRRLLP